MPCVQLLSVEFDAYEAPSAVRYVWDAVPPLLLCIWICRCLHRRVGVWAICSLFSPSRIFILIILTAVFINPVLHLRRGALSPVLGTFGPRTFLPLSGQSAPFLLRKLFEITHVCCQVDVEGTICRPSKGMSLRRNNLPSCSAIAAIVNGTRPSVSAGIVTGFLMHGPYWAFPRRSDGLGLFWN